jgi:hypothetical protein
MLIVCRTTWATNNFNIGPNLGNWNVAANWQLAGSNSHFVPDASFNEAALINNGATVVVNAPADNDVGGVKIGVSGLAPEGDPETGGLLLNSFGVLRAVVSPDGSETGAITIGAGAGTGSLMLASGMLFGTSLSLGGSNASNISLSGAASLTISGAASLQRTTTITGPSVNFSAGGDLSLSGTSVLVQHILSVTSHSPLVTHGAATIDGTLKPVFTGVTPMLGDSWTLIDAAIAINGGFSNLDVSLAPALPAGQTYRLVHTVADGRQLLQLSIEAMTLFSADFDNDGDVDGEDLVQWRGGFGASDLSDADDDGDSDGADFLAWQRQAGSGVDLLASSRAVPEPTSWLLLVVATLRPRSIEVVCRKSRRKTLNRADLFLSGR